MSLAANFCKQQGADSEGGFLFAAVMAGCVRTKPLWFVSI